MILADSWYASGTFWAIAGVVAVIVVGAVSSWVVWRAANPRRRLTYAVSPPYQLVNAGGLGGSIEVRRNGAVLTNPYLVTVTLTNLGRFDIPKSVFEDTPLRFDVGTTILEVLDVASEPAGLKAPKTKLDGTALLVGPDKIGKEQRISITLLLDGEKPRFTRPDNPLVDVELREVREEAGLSWSIPGKSLVAPALVAFSTMGIAVLTALIELLATK